MKLIIALVSFGLAIAMLDSAHAVPQKRAKASKSVKKTVLANKKMKKTAPQEHLQTSHNFEDHGVTGEYQMPDEALAKVENEKSLADLLGVRKHFKDRLLEASEQE